MMTGDSMMMAKAKATPKAARLTAGASSLAMIAARYGPSRAIISQVPANGAQKAVICLYVSGVADVSTVRFIGSWGQLEN